MSSRRAPQRRFTSLAATECLDLVGSHAIGRVGWSSVEGPTILPVAYAMRDGLIVFRTASYGTLAELVDDREVAFEVDEFDPTIRTGWSVLVRGTARAAANPDELAGHWQQDEPIPWATGERHLFIEITPGQVSGRVISR